MTAYMSKAQLLENMQTGYTAFEAILAPLSVKQMTTPGVNSTWTVKDNLAHITAWQRRTISKLQAIQNDIEFLDPLSDSDTDEVNEQIYQRNKHRSLEDVQSDFRASYEQLRQLVQATSEEALNIPRSWQDNQPIWISVTGNTNEHYQEHGDIIKAWLARGQA